MANRIQLDVSVPHRESVGGDTQPPATNTRREYIKEIYRYFGWTIPPQWQTEATPEPQFSEPESTDTPKTKRIRVVKKK